MIVNEDILFIIVDLFCGAGGTTTGFENATLNGKKIAQVVACVNHDKYAIESHAENHPHTLHFFEDIKKVSMKRLADHIAKMRIIYPNAKVLLHASLECTNFSKAKGGLPRNADSRTLANHLFRYFDNVDYDYVTIENVVEFMAWGNLDENGKPIGKTNGKQFLKWCARMKSYGFDYEWAQLNSADYGAHTSRKRLFGIFAKHGLPIVFPEPTHSKKVTSKSKKQQTLFEISDKQPWNPVKECLNFEDTGKSIFDRKTPLSDNTLERVFAGLVKFVADGDKTFISNYKSGHPASKNTSIESPCGSLTTKPTQALVDVKYLLNYNHSSTVNDIEQPSPTLTTKDKLSIVQTQFLSVYYGNGFNRSTDEPAPTLTTTDRLAQVTAKYFIYRDFSNGGSACSVDQPAGSVLPIPKLSLVEAKPFLMPTSYGNKPKSIDEPAPTIQASRRHHYLVNPQYNSGGSSVDQPCFTLIARMDKRPPYLVQTECGHVAIPVYETDSEVMVRIKAFMAYYGLSDILMRMLYVYELLKIQGFPDGYKLKGNQTQQKKQIGNAVVPIVPQRMTEALSYSLLQLKAA